MSFAARVQRVVQALATATERVEICASTTDKAGGAPAELERVLERLEIAQEKQRLRALRRDPDLLISSASLVFAAEETSAKFCGPPQGLDLVLLLIGRSHGEGTR